MVKKAHIQGFKNCWQCRNVVIFTAKKSFMKKIILPLFFISFICSAACAQTKVGVVSVDAIFAIMPDTYKADSMISNFQKELSATYQDQQQGINAAIEKFYKDSAKMTVSLRDIKRKDLQERVTALGSKEKELNKALENEKEKLLKPVKDKLYQAIKDVAKENAYTHVAYKEQMIIFPEADDLSDKVKIKLGIK